MFDLNKENNILFIQPSKVQNQKTCQNKDNPVFKMKLIESVLVECILAECMFIFVLFAFKTKSLQNIFND